MKSFVLLLMFAAFLAITIGYINQIKTCPAPKIEYRYIPRTFEQEQNEPVKLSQLFNSMFVDPTPWVRDLGVKPSPTEINRYFVSQA